MTDTPTYLHWPPGLQRRSTNVWVDADGNRIDDEVTLARLRALALPPAWRHVWASPDPHARIQARGIDSRGRVQYRYSAEATEQAAKNKFSHMLHFAENLPQLRARVMKDLRRRPPSPDVDQVTALAVRILDLGLFRVGTGKYARDNHTYGLTTLEPSHVKVHSPQIDFDFIGKEHIRQQHQLYDRPSARVMSNLLATHSEASSDFLFRTENPSHRVDSATVNSYIHAVSGSAASAKVFRTWGATVIAAAVTGGAAFQTEQRHKDPTLHAYDAAAHVLGNTPTMARSSYVHPRATEIGQLESVRNAVQDTAERMGTDDVHRIFADEELQETVRIELVEQ